MQNEVILQALLTPQHEIIKNKLYLGNGSAADEAINKASKNETKPAIAIVRCTHSVAKGEEAAIANGSIMHLDVKFGDKNFSAQSAEERQAVMDNFHRVYDFIEDALSKNIKVLVHCDGGAHRSPTILIAYLIRKEQIDVATAEARVKKIRACVDIDNHREFLKLLQQELQIENAPANVHTPLLNNNRRSCTCTLF